MTFWPKGTFALKVDIDTRSGLERGVPNLLADLRSLDLRATFFASYGPDNSGRALLKLITNPRFALKMLRTRAAKTYGLRTALSGVLLPARLIGTGRPDIVKSIIEADCEVEVHAWDHRIWQDSLQRRDAVWVRNWLSKAFEAHHSIVGTPAHAFGAPAWKLTETAISELVPFCLEYSSSTRATEPFFLEPSGLLEIPGNVPCLEEVGSYEAVLEAALKAGSGVITLHAEVEGGAWRDGFVDKLLRPLSQQARLITMSEMAKLFAGISLPRRHFEERLLPGRSEACAM